MDVILIPLDHNYLDLVRNWRNYKEVSQYMYTEGYITKEQHLKWFNLIQTSTNSKYWIIEYNKKPLGVVNITNIDNNHKSCDWAFYLGDTTFRGEGIGSKVEYNIINYVFNDLNLNKLKCEVFTFNEKVIKMHEKFGFRRESYYRQHVYKNNIYYDVVGLGLLKEDWQQIKDYHYERIYNR